MAKESEKLAEKKTEISETQPETVSTEEAKLPKTKTEEKVSEQKVLTIDATTKQKVSKLVGKLFEKFYDTGNPIKTKIGKATIELGLEELENGDESIFLNDIFVDHTSQGKGEATKALSAIIDYADNNNMPISLRASSGGHYEAKGMAQEDLIKWYQKHGFELAPNASKFGYDEIFMVRNPKQIKQESEVQNAEEITRQTGETVPQEGTERGGIGQGSVRNTEQDRATEEQVAPATEKEKKEEEKEITKVAEKTSIKPKNLRDVYKAGREVFGIMTSVLVCNYLRSTERK